MLIPLLEKGTTMAMGVNELTRSVMKNKFPGDDLLETIDRFITNTMFTNFEGHLENLHYKIPDQNVFKKKIEDGTIDYVIELALPGFVKEDVCINIIDDNTLEINGSIVKEDDYPKNCNYSLSRLWSMEVTTTEYTQEYSGFTLKKKFKRKFLVPNINTDTVNATFENGILIINLKSGKRKDIRQISIS